MLSTQVLILPLSINGLICSIFNIQLLPNKSLTLQIGEVRTIPSLNQGLNVWLHFALAGNWKGSKVSAAGEWAVCSLWIWIDRSLRVLSRTSSSNSGCGSGATGHLALHCHTVPPKHLTWRLTRRSSSSAQVSSLAFGSGEDSLSTSIRQLLIGRECQ